MNGAQRNIARLWLTTFLACASLFSVGCSEPVDLSCSLRPDMETRGKAQADCDVTFKRLPKRGSATDLRIELDGQTLIAPLTFDYAFLAPLDKTSGGPLDVTAPPPLDHRFRWRMPIELVPALQPSIGDFIVHVTLYWGGEKQTMARMNTKSVYSPE